MTYREFLRSVEARELPPEIHRALAAMWYARAEDWAHAHELVQSETDRDSAWVHAFLHRKEGDLENAAYWYRVAGLPMCNAGLDEEWAEITQQLLVRSSTSEK